MKRMALTETTACPSVGQGVHREKKESLSIGFIFRLAKQIKPIFFSVSSSELGERVRNGFTLIEILVALVIVAITVSVVLEAQITSLKIEQKARSLRLFRFETQRIFSATHRVKNYEELAQLLETNSFCRIKSEKVKVESGTNVISFIKHALSAKDLPEFSSVFFIRVPDYPRQKSDAITDPVKKQ